MDKEKKSQKQKMTHKQAAAMTGIVLLVLLYVITFIVAIVDKSDTSHWFYIFLFATFAVPLLTWIYIWMYSRLTGRSVVGDPKGDSSDQIKGTTSDHSADTPANDAKEQKKSP